MPSLRKVLDLRPIRAIAQVLSDGRVVTGRRGLHGISGTASQARSFCCGLCKFLLSDPRSGLCSASFSTWATAFEVQHVHDSSCIPKTFELIVLSPSSRFVLHMHGRTLTIEIVERVLSWERRVS